MELHAFPMIAIILAISTVAGLIAVRLRQPLIVAFLVVGIAVGPVGAGWVRADNTIELLAKLGIAILLFLVGLRLDLHMIRSSGPVAVATGLGQVIFTSVIGYLIAIALGMDIVTALYIAVALTFSSTIIIVKLLSDKRELDELHGRIAVGFLIVQDILVVLVMIALTAFGQDTGDSLVVGIVTVLLKGAGLLGGAWLLMRYILPWLLPYIAKSPELLVLFGVSYAVMSCDAEHCKRVSDHYTWHALEPRAPRANKAKYAEKVEEHLDQARFWETAAAMLKAAKVKTLGELLED